MKLPVTFSLLKQLLFLCMGLAFLLILLCVIAYKPASGYSCVGQSIRIATNNCYNCYINGVNASPEKSLSTSEYPLSFIPGSLRFVHLPERRSIRGELLSVLPKVLVRHQAQGYFWCESYSTWVWACCNFSYTP